MPDATERGRDRAVRGDHQHRAHPAGRARRGDRVEGEGEREPGVRGRVARGVAQPGLGRCQPLHRDDEVHPLHKRSCCHRSVVDPRPLGRLARDRGEGGGRASREGWFLDRVLRGLLLPHGLALRPVAVRGPRAHPGARGRAGRRQPPVAPRPGVHRPDRAPGPPGAAVPGQAQPVERAGARPGAARHRADPGVPRLRRRPAQPPRGRAGPRRREGRRDLPGGHHQPRSRPVADALPHRRGPPGSHLGRPGAPGGALGHPRGLRRLPEAVPPAAAQAHRHPLRTARRPHRLPRPGDRRGPVARGHRRDHGRGPRRCWPTVRAEPAPTEFFRRGA